MIILEKEGKKMNEEQIEKIITMTSDNYNGYKFSRDLLDTWNKMLEDYDYEDVKKRIEDLLASDEFKLNPPNIYHILKPLIKNKNKVDFSKATYNCDLCNRAFNDKDEMLKHQDRCHSVRYISKQMKKWFNKDFNKKELYELEENEFQKRYDDLLKYIMEHTTDEKEKQRIGFIFNPPTPEEVAKYFSK